MNPTDQHAAFLQLIQDNKGILFKITNSYCRNRNDREDLMQEVVCQLWKSGQSFDTHRKFSTWMYRIAGIVIGMIYLALLVIAFWYVRTQPVMAISFGVFIVCTVIAIGMYMREIGVIGRISYGDNIIDTQQKLAGIQSSIIWTLRIGWVQLPFWSFFFVSNELLRKGGREFWMIQILITLFLTILAVILYRNITLENAQKKKWVKGMIRGEGMKSVIRAIDFMKEIENFKIE
jgi:glucan phosphoethanolaminetransferase (alkaline phosphatase superfamily)